MKTKAVSVSSDLQARWICLLYQDPNNNWFASYERNLDGSRVTGWTSTYTTQAEALQAAGHIISTYR